MKVLKPSQLSLLTRPYEFQQDFHLGISILAYVPMEEELSLLSEISMWKFAAEALGAEGTLDAAIPKTTCEYLIAGKAHPGGQALGCTVHAQVAQTEKSLLVLGDRVWAGSNPTDPIPFEEMPLTWANAYGGEGVAANPHGKGDKPVEIGGQMYHPLPNIEDPKKPISSKRHRPDPVGFGPLDIMAPTRRKRAGSYKKKWQKTEYPGMAGDMDWRFFNMAPDDQHLPQPWAGGEAYRFQNLHPSEPLIEGRVPCFETRCFLTRKGGDGSLEEIHTQLTTIWFFPDVKRMALIYHGRADIREEDAGDVATTMIAAELPGAPRSIAHYEQVHAKRMDHEQAGVETLNDPDLVPASIAKEDPDIKAITAAVTPSGELLEQQEKQLESQLAELPESPPEDAEEETKEETESSEKEAEELAVMEGPSGPPPEEAPEKRAELEAEHALAEQAGDVATTAALAAMLANQAMWDLETQADANARENYRSDAHNQPPADPLEAEAAAAMREQITAYLQESRDLSGRDWTGADFSGMDLRGVSFAGSFCEAATFEDADLQGADFSGAVLARARLNRARVGGANFETANLALAEIRGLICEAPLNLRGAILDGLQLGGLRLHGSDLTGASLEGTLLRGADLSGIRAEGMMLENMDLRDLNLSGASLPLCCFMNCKLDGLKAVEADLTSATFYTSSGAIDASGATLKQAVFVEKCDLSGSNFSRANILRACLRSSNFDETNFDGAELLSCDLSESNLRNSSFVGATARSCLFIKAQLQGATLNAANLRESIFMNASVQGADFRYSNLYMADLARIRADERSLFDEAFFERVRTIPRYEPRA